MTKFVIVTGGVMSGVGKGVTTAALGKILKEHGYNTTLIKIDPYINYDAGTLRPTEHGEVWVTEDGGEIDQDLGTYERFMHQNIPKQNNITTGQIYQAVIEKERRGEYLGKTVQFIPHIPDEINRRIKQAAQGYEIAIIEIGGTVGDYENIPFLFAAKALECEIGNDHVSYILVTYLPIPNHIHEIKTKPTQQAIKLLRHEGIFPDFIFCRANRPLDAIKKKKIEVYANISSDHIISAPDVKTIYQIPLEFERQQVGKKLLAHLKLPSKKTPHWSNWQTLVERIKKPKKKVTIAIVGKYIDIGDDQLIDSYISIHQALIHAGAQCGIGIDIRWFNAKIFEQSEADFHELNEIDGVIIPGGFGDTGVEGKIKVIHHIRKNNIPFLGLCYGMQLAVVEFARHVCGLQEAHTTEIKKKTPHPIIDILPAQKTVMELGQYGGTMRLGAYDARLKKGSMIAQLYKKHEPNRKNVLVISERHRHRYEVNPRYVAVLEQNGLVFAGFHQRGACKLMEFIELPNHPFFIATQGHPEFKSRFEKPNPLFCGFLQASDDHSSKN